jgi:hypothetical protein
LGEVEMGNFSAHDVGVKVREGGFAQKSLESMSVSGLSMEVEWFMELIK